MKALTLLYIALLATLSAYAQTRPVNLSWTAGAGIASQTISVGSSPAGPFVLLATLSGTAASYSDPAETVGASITYQLTATASPCPPNNTGNTPCGTFAGGGMSASTTASLVIPPLVDPIPTVCFSAPGEFTLSVVGGTGSGSYASGTTIAIVANAAPAGEAFLDWTGATVASPSSASTTLVMPAAATTVTANYQTVTTPTTITYKQENYTTPQGVQKTNAVAVAFTKAQTAGDLNIAVVGWNDSKATVSSVVDSAGNSYELAVGPTVQTGLATQAIYYAKNIAGPMGGALNTVTVTFSNGPNAPDIRILEYAGADPNSPIDITASTQGTATKTASISSGAATTKYANDLIFGANLTQSNTTGAGSGFTSRVITSPDSDIAEDEQAATPGSYAATSTVTSGGWIMQMVAIKTLIP